MITQHQLHQHKHHCSFTSLLLLIVNATTLSTVLVGGLSYAPWASTTLIPVVAPSPTPMPSSIITKPPVSSSSAAVAATTTTVTTNNDNHYYRNPHYPDLPFDNYLANPFFKRINTDYPGLQLIHEEPYIFIVNNFLTDNECDRLIQKTIRTGNSGGSSSGCISKNEGKGIGATMMSLRPQIGGGSVIRTSNGVVCENEEVPTIRQKMIDLANVSDCRQLQHLKISRYTEGQEFSKHTDAWPTECAPVSKGWVNEIDFFGDRKRPIQGCWSSRNKPSHNNYMTCLVYLNDIPQGMGGSTTFPNIGLHTGIDGCNFYKNPSPMDSTIRQDDGSEWDWSFGHHQSVTVHPTKGMALLHFCSLLPEYGGICDGNTFHRADPPEYGQEKFVTQQFFASCPYWDVPEDSQPIGRISNDTI